LTYTALPALAPPRNASAQMLHHGLAPAKRVQEACA
jgi:hypothetical protein